MLKEEEPQRRGFVWTVGRPAKCNLGTRDLHLAGGR
jgi:hypothetical protein